MDHLLAKNVTEVDKGSETVRSFLCGLTGQPSGSPVKETLQYKLHKALESNLDLAATNVILPVHLRESVLLYALTGSSLTLKILGSGGPRASYKVVKEWLASLGSTVSEVPEGDLIVAFDNNQVLQRRWKVRLKNEVKSNIVTIVVFFHIHTSSNLQMQPNLKPSMYLNKSVEDNLKKIKYLDQDSEVKMTQYKHLHDFLANEIQTVMKEQITGDTVKDDIDDLVRKHEKEKLFKLCYNCNFDEVPLSKQKCPKCKANVTKTKMASMGLDAHGNIESELHKQSKPKPQEYRISLQPNPDISRRSYSLHKLKS